MVVGCTGRRCVSAALLWVDYFIVDIAMDEAGSASDTVCGRLCGDLWELGEECLHDLVKCAECGHVWDGFAQCSHPVW